ncbi:MAG: hypothetical protein HQL31_00780 [Planctomycetes bacterium]|nr:hypothetical protein [Planctomycetota bacterium]
MRISAFLYLFFALLTCALAEPPLAGGNTASLSAEEGQTQKLVSPGVDPLLEEIVREGLPTRIIPVEGVIAGLLSTTLKRRTEEALADGVRLIVYRIKSDGGELGAAFEMANYVFGLPENIKVIAFVEDKAYSAAALFSLACDDLYMKAGSALGDCEPIVMSQDGYKTMGDKVQSPLRERFRTYAQKNGYPVLLAEAMVSSDMKILHLEKLKGGEHTFMEEQDFALLGPREREIYKVLKFAVKEGKLLTLGEGEARELGFSGGTFADVNALLKHLGFSKAVPVMEPSDSELVLEFIEQWTALFLLAAIFFAYLEFKTPGIGIFAALSAICMVAFFTDKFYTGQANYWEIFLFLAGVGLLLVELLVIPGFGLAGFTGLGLMVLSLLLSMQDFTLPQGPGDIAIVWSNLSLLSSSLVGATLLFAVLLFFLPKGKGGDDNPGLIHAGQQPLPGHEPQKGLAEGPLKGQRGVALSDLRPSGRAKFGDNSHQVQASEGWISKGTPLVVVHQAGNRVVVSALEQGPADGLRPPLA